MNDQEEKSTQIEMVAVLNTLAMAIYQDIEDLKRTVNKFYEMFELLQSLLNERN